MTQVTREFKISVQNQLKEVKTKKEVTKEVELQVKESEHNDNGDCINITTTLSELQENNKSMYK